MLSSDNERSITLIVKLSGKVKPKAPLCKGSSAAGGEGLFLQPFRHASRATSPYTGEALAIPVSMPKGTCDKISQVPFCCFLTALSEGKLRMFLIYFVIGAYLKAGAPKRSCSFLLIDNRIFKKILLYKILSIMYNNSNVYLFGEQYGYFRF